MRDLWIIVGVAALLAAYIVYSRIKKSRERKRECERLEQIDRILEADPHLAEELDKIDGLLLELEEDYLKDLTAGQQKVIMPVYHKLDERFDDLYGRGIAEMERGAVCQEIRDIEKMLTDLKVQIAELTGERIH